MNNENNIAVLNDLIETSRDCLVGYKKCADYACDLSLKSYFQDRAKDYVEAVRALSNEVREYEGIPSLNGTTKRALHRALFELKAAIKDENYSAVLEECKRVDSITLTAYQDALSQDLPNILRITINLQLKKVERNLAYARLLRVENNQTVHNNHKLVA